MHSLPRFLFVIVALPPLAKPSPWKQQRGGAEGAKRVREGQNILTVIILDLV